MMRKIYLKTAFLLLVASMLIIAFASCRTDPNKSDDETTLADTKIESESGGENETETETELTEAERVDRILGALNGDFADSYEMGMSIRFAGTYADVPVELQVAGTTTYTDLLMDITSYHETMEMVMKMEVNGEEIVQKRASISGYRDGKLYEMRKEDGKQYALVSSITPQAYQKHLINMVDKSSEISDDLVKGAETKTCTKDANGNWCVTFSGYTGDALEVLMDDIFSGIDQFTEGYEARDISLEITVTDTYVPVGGKIDVSFQRADMDQMYVEPELSAVVEYREIGTTSLPEMDFSTYTEVEGLASLLEVRKTLQAYRDINDFSFVSTNDVRTVYGGQLGYSSEQDIFDIHLKDGKYAFDIVAIKDHGSASETTINVSYADGIYKVSGKETQTQTESMSEDTARKYIFDYLDVGDLCNAFISDIKKDQAGYSYVFTIADPDYSSYEEAYAAYDAKNFGATAEVAVKYENGILSEYKYNFRLTATVENRYLETNVGVTITIDNTAVGENPGPGVSLMEPFVTLR